MTMSCLFSSVSRASDLCWVDLNMWSLIQRLWVQAPSKGISEMWWHPNECKTGWHGYHNTNIGGTTSFMPLSNEWTSLFSIVYIIMKKIDGCQKIVHRGLFSWQHLLHYYITVTINKATYLNIWGRESSVASLQPPPTHAKSKINVSHFRC